MSHFYKIVFISFAFLYRVLHRFVRGFVCVKMCILWKTWTICTKFYFLINLILQRHFDAFLNFLFYFESNIYRLMLYLERRITKEYKNKYLNIPCDLDVHVISHQSWLIYFSLKNFEKQLFFFFFFAHISSFMLLWIRKRDAYCVL